MVIYTACTKRPGKGNNTTGVIYLALIIVGRLVLSTEWYMKASSTVEAQHFVQSASCGQG